MAIIRSQGVAGQAVRLSNPAVDRSIRAWEERIERAEASAYERAKKELEQQYQSRIAAAEKASAAAQASVDARVAELAEQHRQAWGSTLAALAQVTNELERLRSATVEAAEGEILRLALAVAGRVLHRELTQETASWLAPVLQAALADLPNRHGVVVRLHPAAAEQAQQHLTTALQALEDPPETPTIVADPVLSPGSCRIESAGTVIDGGLPNAWKRVVDHLLEDAPSQDLGEEVQVVDGNDEAP